MHLLQYNNNLTDSSKTQILNLNKTCNNLITNLKDWNIFLKNLLITSLDLPIMNIYDYVLDKTNGRTIYSITLYDDTGYNFFVSNSVHPLYFGVDQNGTTDYYKGVCVYLQYNNSEYPNENKSSNTKYYNIHYVQNFLNMVNNAIKLGLSLYTSSIIQNANIEYFYTAGQPYTCNMDDSFVSSTVDLYFNTNLKNILDGFRVIYYQNSDLNNPNYNGMSYKFNKTNSKNNLINATTPYWVFNAEFQCINSLSTFIGLGIECGGSLSCVRDTVYSYFDSSNTGINLQTKKILKILDFNYDGYNSISGNNYLQYESLILDVPINCLSIESLINFSLQFYLISISGSFVQIELQPNSAVKCNIVFKKK